MHGDHLHSDFEISCLKNLVRRTGFFVYFKLDFYCLHSLQKSSSKQKKTSSVSNQIFRTRYFKNQAQACIDKLYFTFLEAMFQCFWYIFQSLLGTGNHRQGIFEQIQFLGFHCVHNLTISSVQGRRNREVGSSRVFAPQRLSDT